MVKLYTSLLSLTLVTSLALAAPHHYYDRDLLERDLDEEFSEREYLLDAYDDLAARDPSFLSGIGHAFSNIGHAVVHAAVDVGKVAVKGLHVVEKVAENPYVQAASAVLPGGLAIVAAEKAIETVGKVERMAENAGRTVNKVEGALRKGPANMLVKTAVRQVGKLTNLGGTIGKVNPIGRARQVLPPAHRRHHSRHHRRDLEDDGELSRRVLDAEELWEREYDGSLAERDFLDDLD